MSRHLLPLSPEIEAGLERSFGPEFERVQILASGHGLRPAKQVQDTSIEAYREIAPSLPRREADVYGFLSGWLVLSPPPTSYELFGAMQRVGAAKDLNAVRPRLTALQTRGLVEKGEKRRCRITGKTAYTWRVVLPERAGE